MRRGITGSYETASVGGEHVRAFIPYPLPPEPPLDLSNARQRLLERATLALGRLDSKPYSFLTLISFSMPM
jgi:hypothetical protein